MLTTVGAPSPHAEEPITTSNLTTIALSELVEEDQYQLALSLLERLAELAAQRGPAQVSFSGEMGGTLLATVRVLTLNQQNLIRRLRHTVEMLDILEEKIAWLKQQKEGIAGAAIDYSREIRIKQELRQKEMAALTALSMAYIYRNIPVGDLASYEAFMRTPVGAKFIDQVMKGLDAVISQASLSFGKALALELGRDPI